MKLRGVLPLVLLLATLPGGGAHAVAAMHAGFKTEVRRRAMEQL